MTALVLKWCGGSGTAIEALDMQHIDPAQAGFFTPGERE